MVTGRAQPHSARMKSEPTRQRSDVELLSRNTTAAAIGQNVRAARKIAGLTQEQLSERLMALIGKVTDPYVSMIETGKNLAAVEVYSAIAEILGTTLDKLFKKPVTGSPLVLARFIEQARDDGDVINETEEEFLNWVTIPGRQMTASAYAHALAMFRAARER